MQDRAKQVAGNCPSCTLHPVLASVGNIASHLQARAEAEPHRLAVVVQEPSFFKKLGFSFAGCPRYTFRQLHEESDRLARGLEAIGLGRGMRVALMVKPGLDFFALTFALFKIGAVPVMIDPGMGTANLKKCLQEAKPEAFIGIPRAHMARLMFGWGKDSIRINVTVGRRWFWGGFTLDQVRARGGEEPRREDGESRSENSPRSRFPSSISHPPSSVATTAAADEIAAILFTSGSTGPPKGAVYTHAIFATQVEILRQLYGIEPGEIDLPTFPLFALFAPALGMTAVIPDMDFTRPGHVDPRKIVEAIDHFRVTNMFGSPALLKRVGEWCEGRHIKFPTLRRVISAGAPVSAEVLERFSRLLNPGVQIFTPYGATEALPVCSIGSDEILKETREKTAQGAGICVGRPVEQVRVRIIKINDGPIPAWSEKLLAEKGEVGEIVAQGPIVTAAYYNRPDATALAKIADPEQGRFYHRMGDVGHFDDLGRLWFCGRKSQRVVALGRTFFTIPCEAVFNAHPQVSRTALVGVHKGSETTPVVCVELKKQLGKTEREGIANELLALGAAHDHTRDIELILFYPRAFPVDIRHNAKIFREQLAVWAAKELGCMR